MKLPSFLRFPRASSPSSASPQPHPLHKVWRHFTSRILTPGLAAKIALFAPLAATATAALAKAPKGAPVADPQIHWWQGIILGLVQGLTEFIPVSSSAHLNITHWLMHQPRELTYDVFLHIGTLAALAYYFRHDWKALLTDPKQSRLRNLVLLGCVPAAIAGLLLRKIEDHPPLSEVWFNAVMLIVAGGVLYLADITGRQKRVVKNINLKDALIIGTSQAIALFPGVSRSGATLTAGLFLGLKREDAARFSFLMSLPVTLGAAGFEFLKFLHEGHNTMTASAFTVVIGILTSAASGFWAISFLLNYLKTKNVLPFFVWRVAVGLLVLALVLGGHK